MAQAGGIAVRFAAVSDGRIVCREDNAVPAMSENRNTAMTMIPGVPERVGMENLQPLGAAGLSTQLWLAPPGQKPDKAPTSVSLSDQGLV